MSLQQWYENAWLKTCEPSAVEVANLLSVAERELNDASLAGISPDGRFDHAYSAIRTLAKIALHACGYTVPRGAREHEHTIESLKFTLGGEWVDEVDYFDRCRRMRHQSQYDHSGVAQEKDANDLRDAAGRLHDALREWLRSDHPDLI